MVVGRWPLAEGSDGRWSLAVGRWPKEAMADGRWPLAEEAMAEKKAIGGWPLLWPDT
jgi:hypothetical protein